MERRTEDVLRRKTGLAVDFRVEVLIGVGVMDDSAFAGRKDVSGHPDGVQHPNLAAELAVGNPRVEFPGSARR